MGVTSRGAVPLVRWELGAALRRRRVAQRRSLRELSTASRVSLGYLSEVERGRKEASSELLASICSALEVPLSVLLREVSDALAVQEASVRTVPLAVAGGPLAGGPVAAGAVDRAA